MTSREVHYWDTVAATWKEAQAQGLWRAHSDEVNALLFTRWLPADMAGRLLKTDLFDEAVGDGLYLLLASRAHHVVGIDVSVLTSHRARSHHAGLRATGADARRLPFADGVFDVVLSNSTLDHFETHGELLASLCELRRVLRTGGELLITLDNHANPAIAVRNALPFRLLNRIGVLPYYVGATYGPLRLQRTLHQLGLEVLEISTVMHCPRMLAIAMARLLAGRTRPETQRRFLRLLMTFERLSRWPTRFLTGHFVAVRAVRH